MMLVQMAQNGGMTAALGTFDGLHLAHREILSAAAEGGNGICITFLYPPKGGFIMQPQIKKQRLYEMGFKRVVMLDFSEVKELGAEEFLEEITTKYNIGAFFAGYDYSFGKNRSGNAERLREFSQKKGLECHIEKQISINGEKVSSSAIRDCLARGDMQRAIEFLGHPLEIEAPVIHGDARGRTIGFPTANQPLPNGFAPLKFGVYSSEVVIENERFSAITNIGIRPTFPLKTPLCETHILNFSGDLYGKTITLCLKAFIRDERKFSSVLELEHQLEEDIKASI